MPANPPVAAAVPLSGRRPASRGVFGHTAVLAVVATCLFATTAVAQTYEVLKAFTDTGVFPAGVIQGTDGNLYGTTESGGASGYGTIFKIDTNGTTLTTLHSFAYSDGAAPYAGLTQGTDRNLYGTTYQGGANGGYGTIFKIDTNGSTLTTLHSFASSDGANPYAGLLQGSDGNLYGTTVYGGANGYGTIFKIDTNGSTLTTLHSFTSSDGANPYAGLIQGTDGNLYGTTYQGGANGYGTIFKIDTNGSRLTTLHSFTSSDGANPYAGLIQGTDGNLYGTTYFGGTQGFGTIFKIDSNGATLTTLHSFARSDGEIPFSGLIQGTDGNLYGTSAGGGVSDLGTIFKIDTNGATFATLHSFTGSDGAIPHATLIQGSDGNLYGTTYYGGAEGGAQGFGTIFKIDTNGTMLTTLHIFATYGDGETPLAGLAQATDGNLYGTTYQGGTQGYGEIFKIDTTGLTFTTLHSFGPYPYTDGEYPQAGLIQGTDGSLYGTTAISAAAGYGIIFKIDINGSTFTTLHDFAYNDGAWPLAGVIQGTDGNLYGTTSGGGANGNNGTIFKIDTNGSTLTSLHSFTGTDGAGPRASLIQGSDGDLYGTTSSGGASGYGTVFKIDTSGTTFATLHNFDGGDGAYPYGGLIQGSDGTFYGTTSSGGASGYAGTIFRIDANGTVLTTLHSFDGSDGDAPLAGLIQGTDGNLYGTTSSGGASGNNGTIFEIDSNGTVLTTLHSFDWNDGSTPRAGLIQGADGSFYGTTSGGAALGGVVFRLILSGAAFQVTGVAPPSGPGGTGVSITGSGFESTDTVSIGGAGATGVTWVSPTQINAITPMLSAGTLNDVVVTKLNSSSAQLSKAFFADFLDVPRSHAFHSYVVKVAENGITAGCGGNNYCPDSPVTRAQMAVFLLRAEHGSSYTPPACTSPGVFGDVPCPGGFAVDWTEQLYKEGITGGCSASPLLYCPDQAVTRAQMAVFLLRAEHGSSYMPPACTPGIFGDVSCPGGFAVDWIEQLSAEGITGGCGGGNYCPDNHSTRGQMAVFLVTTFKLP